MINAKFHGYELDEKLKVKVRNDRLVKDQKQPPEVFCKKKFSEKFHKIHMKIPVPESLF